MNVAIPHWRGKWLPRMASLFIRERGVVSMMKAFVRDDASGPGHAGGDFEAIVGVPGRDGCSLLNSRGPPPPLRDYGAIAFGYQQARW